MAGVLATKFFNISSEAKAYGRAARAKLCDRRILVMETTSMALVILAMFLTDRILLFMSRREGIINFYFP